MTAGDLLILAALVPAGILAVRSIWKKRKTGGCGCCGDCGGCGCDRDVKDGRGSV